MDPLEPAKNDENGGFSKRRISSILKAPRKSAICLDPVQQDCTVELCKPAEKRVSRRVSFAPANDVLLFSNDLKKSSPGRSPLQELMTTSATPQNRVHMVGTEDASQQIKGMETLLNAPLHHGRQLEKVTTEGLGERTVMFCDDDALMNMTHSHTINIAHDEDVFFNNPQQSKPAGGNLDFCASPSVPEFDSDFKDFLSSLSKSGSIAFPHITPAAATAADKNPSQASDVCKENQAPFVVTSKSVHKAHNQESSFGKAEEEEEGTAAEDDPFGFLFPSKEMLKARRESMSRKTSQQQSSTDPGRLTGVTSLTKSSTPAPRLSLKADDMDLTQNHTVHVATRPVSSTSSGFRNIRSNLSRLSMNPDTRTPLQTLHVVDPGTSLNRTRAMEETIFPGDKDQSMDLTEAQTGHIFEDTRAAVDLPPERTGGRSSVLMKTSAHTSVGDAVEGPKNKAQTFKGEDETGGRAAHLPSHLQQKRRQSDVEAQRRINEAEMDMTQCLTRNIETDLLLDSLLNKGQESNSDPGRTLRTSEESVWDQDVSMELTETQTGQVTELDMLRTCPQSVHDAENIHRQSAKNRRQSGAAGLTLYTGRESSIPPWRATSAEQKVNAEDHDSERTVRFSAEDACMDVTQSHTANIAAHLVDQENLDPSSSVGDKTIRFNANEADMDVTTSHTANVAAHLDFAPSETTVRFTAKDAAMDMTQCLTVQIDAVALRKVNEHGGERTVWFDAKEAAMEMTRSHTANVASYLHTHQDVPSGGEKTIRFNPNEAEMDMTRCHTVSIADYVRPQENRSREFMSGGERTIQFQAQDADMDITKCCTVNEAACLDPAAQQKHDVCSGERVLPECEEKTLRFNDAAMDVTKNHTVSIEAYLETRRLSNQDSLDAAMRLQSSEAPMDVTKSHTVTIAADLESHQHDLSPVNAEKTLRFNDAAMDVTKNHTVNIEAYLETRQLSNQDSLDAAMRLQSSEAPMDVTKSHTVNIAADLESHQHDLSAGSAEKTFHDKSQDHIETYVFSRSRSALHSDSGLLTRTAKPRLNMTISEAASSSLQETHVFLDQPQSVDDDKQCSTGTEPLERQTLRFSDESLTVTIAAETQDSSPASREMLSTSAATHALKSTADPHSRLELLRPEPHKSRTHTDDLHDKSQDHVQTYVFSRSRSLSALHSDSGLLTKTAKPRLNMTISEAASSSPQETDVVLDQPQSVDDDKQCSTGTEPLDMDLSRNLTEAHNVVEETLFGPTCDSEPQGSSDLDEPVNERSPQKTIEDQNGEASPTARKSRRMSLVDLQTKVRRLSHMLSSAPKDAPLPDLDPDKTCNDILPEDEPAADDEDEGHAEDEPAADDEDEGHAEGQRLNFVTPLNLKTKALMSRVSVGSIKPKLPQRCKVVEEKTNVDFVSDDRPGDLDHDVSDINDEELGSYEDVSETLDVKSPPRSRPPERLDLDLDTLQDQGFTTHGKKRGLLADEGAAEEKRMKPDDAVQEDPPSPVPHMKSGPSAATQPMDMSSSRCEATFETTFDCTSDVLKKLEDVNITVSEFLKLFSINFVIHHPRHSIPGTLQSEDCTEMHALKERHVLLPKQRIYEKEDQHLAERMEQLKVRKEDLDKPLRMVNQKLWTEMKTFSEQELKCFGVKLKEQHRFFSKLSKEKSHEQKVALYLELLRAHEEEEVKVRRSIEEADEVINGLDECIAQMEAEVTAIQETSVDGKPSLKSLQEELQMLTQTLDQNNRLVCELETHNNLNSTKINRLKMETKHLENQVDLLNLLSEWRIEEKTKRRTRFSFLHGTLQLEVAHEDGDEKEQQAEKKVTNIDFTFQLDDERSQDHARLVHRLVSQHLQAQTSWLDKYPTWSLVPKLLADVGLVVSRCRLLGEEVRVLKMWGGLRLDILDISCPDTRVQILFSSLNKSSKFEVVLSASVGDHACVLQLFSFKSLIGDNSLSQVNKVVTSTSPGRKLLTRMVKKIHEDLLS